MTTSRARSGRIPAIFFWTTILLTTGVPTVMAVDPSPYERMKMISEKEILGEVDRDIARFTMTIIKDKYNFTLTEEDVNAAAKTPASFLGSCGRNQDHVERCQNIQKEIAGIVTREERVRRLGRNLYVAVGGYEIPLGEHLGKFGALAPILGSLLHMWQSGSDRASGADTYVNMRAAPLPTPESDTEEKYDDLKGELDKLVEKQGEVGEDLSGLAAAVTRYRFGYKAVAAGEDCASATGSGGELGLLWHRWCDVETALDAVWNHMHGSLEGNISRDEIALFPTWLYKDINVVVWVNDRDAGIDWEIPMEPVLPQLLNDRDYHSCLEDGGDEDTCYSAFPPTIIPGGASLAPPQAGGGGSLCNMPVGSDGFLCRALEQPDCSISFSPGFPPGIRLAACRQPVMKTPIRTRPSGPDVCRVGGWRLETESPTQADTANRQETAPNSCSNCSVDLYCANTCPGGGAYTEQRQPNGVIHVCIPNALFTTASTNVGTGYYDAMILHELVHVQQQCSDPKSAFTGTLDQCCSSEYEAYFIQCTALAEDGILADMHIPLRGKDLPISPELCAATLSTTSCRSLGQCSNSPLSGDAFVVELGKAQERNKDRLGANTSCPDAIANLDPRSRTIIASLPDVCTPQCRSEYENTIGNNLCFIGQCIEQSWEEERLVPGRMSLNVGDEAFPWDSCIGAEPAANPDPPTTSRLVLPTLSFPPLPEYNPWAVAQVTDRALCQLLGLPPRTPPTLCAVEVSRQLSRPLSDSLDMLVNLAMTLEDQTEPALELERATQGTGARYATGLYRSQIGPLQRSVAEIFATAATLFEEIGATTFPEQMCSRVDRACPFLPSASQP